MRIIYLLLIIFIFSFNLLFSQNNKYNKDLPLYTIKNKEFDSIVNNMASYIKKCKSYSESQVFSIVITKMRKDEYKFHFDVNDYEGAILSDITGNPLGYFIIKNKKFFIFNNIPNEIFEKTGEKINVIINDDIYIFVADYTMWIYLYKEGAFSLIQMGNECSTKK